MDPLGGPRSPYLHTKPPSTPSLPKLPTPDQQTWANLCWPLKVYGHRVPDHARPRRLALHDTAITSQGPRLEFVQSQPPVMGRFLGNTPIPLTTQSQFWVPVPRVGGPYPECVLQQARRDNILTGRLPEIARPSELQRAGWDSAGPGPSLPSRVSRAGRPCQGPSRGTRSPADGPQTYRQRPSTPAATLEASFPTPQLPAFPGTHPFSGARAPRPLQQLAV